MVVAMEFMVIMVVYDADSIDCSGDRGADICSGEKAEMVSLTTAHTLPREVSVSVVGL